MRIFIAFLIFLLSFSCNKERECEIIRNKEEVNGIYYFYFRPNYLPNSQASNLGRAELGTQYVSGKVSKEVYDQYAIGDEYCF
jgi:hypothetical protein